MSALIVMLAILVFPCVSESAKVYKEKVDLGTGKFYSFASGPDGGAWFTMVGAPVALFTENFAGARFTIESTGGSVENVRRIASGESDFALAHAPHTYDSSKGIGLYEGQKSDKIRVIADVLSSPIYFVALKGSGITNLSDLEGKTVAIGAAGSGTSDNSRHAFAALGIKINEVEMSFADAGRALQDGRIAALAQGGAPAPGVVELAAARDIYIIPLSEKELKTIATVRPYYTPGKLPANMYRGQTEAVPIFQYTIYWIAHKDVPENVVYECLKLAHSKEGLEYLTTVHRQWGPLSFGEEGAKDLELEYHPGALRYWKQ